MSRTTENKFQTVIQKNTFYFFSPKFEEDYEGYVNSLKETLLNVRNRIETEGLKKEIFEELIAEKENGLKALLALSGFSNEYLKRLTTIIRIVDYPELNKLVYKEKWYNEESPENISEWSDTTILKLIRNNKFFKKGLINIFFEGASVPFLAETIPLFELKRSEECRVGKECRSRWSPYH